MTTTDRSVEVLIIGGGPAGATAAIRLLELGIQPLIVEREQFPRFHIGESMTGECGALLRSMGLEEPMVEAGHPVKWGVSVFGPSERSDWWVPVARRGEDLELEQATTWQVRRSQFDKMLLDRAVVAGAELIDGRATGVIADDGRLRGVTVEPSDGGQLDIGADMVLDCSGMATFLANQKVTGPKYRGSYDKQIAVFGHAAGYQRGDGASAEQQPGNTHIYYKEKYHWAWGIPIDDEITSFGVVAPAKRLQAFEGSREDYLRHELATLNQKLADRLPAPEFDGSAHVIPNYSYQVQDFAGPGFICVGDSHRFIDPIFSFGLYVSMKEALFAAQATADYLNGVGRDDDQPFRDHMIEVERASDVLEDVVDTFWENPLAFSVFTHRRYRDGLIDVFAGRIYSGERIRGRDTAVAAFRRLLERERDYDDFDRLSVQVGSRYDPSRAPLWNSTLSDVETTEAWMRAQD